MLDNDADARVDVLARLGLGGCSSVEILADGTGWSTRVTGPGVEPAGDAENPGAGPNEALVRRLREAIGDEEPGPGFRLVRFATPPEARGERPVRKDRTNTSVVVGERVVVKWLRHLPDAEHPGPLTLAHLAAVGYVGVPATYGILLWRTPGGGEVPCAHLSAYLPGARDGHDWCVEVVARTLVAGAASPDPWVHSLPERLGHLMSGLHLSLASRSVVVERPVGVAGPEHLRAWHAQGRRRLELAMAMAAEPGRLPGAAEVLLPRRERMGAAIDTLAELAAAGASTPVQRIHGDLHLGQVLRWSGGLAVVDFDGNPVVDAVCGPGGNPAVQPAARDVAHVLCSLDQIGRTVDKRSSFTLTGAVDAWSVQARQRLLRTYREDLDAAGRSHLFDERLLPALEVEQVCREVLHAGRFLPDWVYSTLGRVRLLVPDDRVARGGFRSYAT